jgi:hypothetical protein
MDFLGPISQAQFKARLSRATAVARELGFVGEVEYRHAISTSGGASFCLAPKIENDLLIVYAEAFSRDATGEDFTLEAIIAHERGHQLLHRHKRLLSVRPKEMSEATEEVLASLLGALIVRDPADQEALELKAVFELVKRGVEPPAATRQAKENLRLLRRFL